MTDIHCHILPGVDDGAETMEYAVLMARMAWESGVRRIIATPHCNLPGLDNYRSPRLSERFSLLQQAVREAGIGIELLPGAEVLGTSQVPQLLRERKLPTLANSRYLLMEFFFDESLEEMDQLLHAVSRAGLVPVIAHPERYEAVQRQPLTVARWFHSGYVIQLNKGSLLGRLGRRAKAAADWIMDRQLAHIIASDAHGCDMRTPHMSQLHEYLLDRYGRAYTDILLHANPGRVAQDLPMVQADEL